MHRMSQTETESHHVPTELRSDRDYIVLLVSTMDVGSRNVLPSGDLHEDTNKSVLNFEHSAIGLLLRTLFCFLASYREYW